MKLDRQLQLLIDEAAQYGIAPMVMEIAIAPVFQVFAQQLQHLEYYVLQNLQEDWVISAIRNRAQGENVRDGSANTSEKRVIYAFTSVRDAKNWRKGEHSDVVAVSLPVVQILFRVFSLQQIDSIIFFTQSGNLDRAVEIPRKDLQNAIEQQLLQLQKRKNVPSDLA